MPLQSHCHLVYNSHIQNRLPSLEHLGLFTSGDSQAHRYFISSAYQIAPSLTSVHIGTSAFSLNDSALPWHQLLSFTGSLLAGIFLQILRVCTRLRSFSVPSVQSRVLDPPLGVVENRSLTRLTFTLNVNSASLLPNVSLPALTDLSMIDGAGGGIIFSSQLYGFLRGIRSLRRLQLRRWLSTKSVDLVELLMLTPKVVSLDIETLQGFPDDFFTALTPTIPHQVEILPMLEHFKCSGVFFFLPSPLQQLIVSRWGGPHCQSDNMCLKSVQIEYDATARARQIVNIDTSLFGQESLRGLKAKGFNLSILGDNQVVL